MKNYILSVDLGTTAIKVILFAQEGWVLAKSTQEYSLYTPDALSVELNVETYWNAFVSGVKDVLHAAQINPQEIRTIGISAQGETLIMLGADGKPLMNAIVWLDNRAQTEAEILGKEFGHTYAYHITGQVKIVPTWPAAKILWLKRNNPEIFRRTKKYLLLEDYFIYRFTGKFVCEGSLVCSTVYWDIIRKKWWSDMLSYLGISEDQLPELKEPGEKVGLLLPGVAAELGLSPDTIITTGALDQACGAIGVGNIKPGIISENTGAALAICATVDRPFFDPNGLMPCHYHGIADVYMAHTFTTGGMTLKWFRDNFCQPETQISTLTGMDTYDILGIEAAQVPPGSDGLVMLPHLAGAMAPEANPEAKGVYFGFTLHHTKPHFVRAVMESIAYIVKRNIDVLEALKIEVKEIRSLGGGSRSDIWNQIKANVTQRNVFTMQNEEAASLGAAILAGTAVGIYPNLEKACEQMAVLKNFYQPQREHLEVYAKMYAKYIKLYESLLDVFNM